MAKTEPTEDSTLPAVTRVQLMPFDIDYDGQAKIADYFETTLRKDTEGGVAVKGEDDADPSRECANMNASFRGRLLNGRNITIPDDYQV